MKTKLLSAIERLQARNQTIVDKYGEGEGSRQMDKIINDLVDIYNHWQQATATDYRQEAEKLRAILDICGFPYREFINYDIAPLKYVARLNAMNEDYTNGHLAILDTRTKLNALKSLLDLDLQAVKIYYDCEPLRKQIKEGNPNLAPYMDLSIPLEKQLQTLTLNFYAGQIAESQNYQER